MTHSLLMDPTSDALAAATLPSEGSVCDSRAVDLLAQWSAGDEQAFTRLVADHQDIAYRFARRICGDHDLARDVVQEAFLRVLRHHERFDRGHSFRAWLLHIVRNLAIDVLRRRRTQSSVPYEDHLRQAVAERASATIEINETKHRINVVLSDLPDKYREILIMREMDGVAAEDIATIIGVDYGTTRWRLHKARTLFREAWTARFGADQP